MINPLLISLINDYLDGIKIGISLFRDKIGDIPPLVAWRDEIIPQNGKLSTEVEYEFHGIGCLLIFPDYEIDFDFGPNNRIDGFDLWRLSQYVSTRKKKYSKYINKSILKKDFEKAIQCNVIKKSDDPYCNLYFLN